MEKRRTMPGIRQVSFHWRPIGQLSHFPFSLQLQVLSQMFARFKPRQFSAGASRLLDSLPLIRLTRVKLQSPFVAQLKIMATHWLNFPSTVSSLSLLVSTCPAHVGFVIIKSACPSYRCFRTLCRRHGDIHHTTLRSAPGYRGYRSSAALQSVREFLKHKVSHSLGGHL